MTEEKSGFGAGSILLGFLGGAAVGATVAYLTAPQSGAQTRKMIKRKAVDVKESVQSIPESIGDAFMAARDKLTDVMEHSDAKKLVNDVKSTAREKLSSSHSHSHHS